MDIVDIDIFSNYAIISASDTFYMIRHSILRKYHNGTMHHSTHEAMPNLKFI